MASNALSELEGDLDRIDRALSPPLDLEKEHAYAVSVWNRLTGGQSLPQDDHAYHKVVFSAKSRDIYFNYRMDRLFHAVRGTLHIGDQQLEIRPYEAFDKASIDERIAIETRFREDYLETKGRGNELFADCRKQLQRVLGKNNAVYSPYFKKKCQKHFTTTMTKLFAYQLDRLAGDAFEMRCWKDDLHAFYLNIKSQYKTPEAADEHIYAAVKSHKQLLILLDRTETKNDFNCVAARLSGTAIFAKAPVTIRKMRPR